MHVLVSSPWYVVNTIEQGIMRKLERHVARRPLDAEVSTAGAKFKEVADRFSKNTTLAGWKNAYFAPTKTAKCIWISLFFAFGIATVWLISYVVGDYLNYQVYISVTVKHEAALPFPAVTVTNNNPFPCSTLAAAAFKAPQQFHKLLLISNCIDLYGNTAQVRRVCV
jgi:hypothetical protein